MFVIRTLIVSLVLGSTAFTPTRAPAIAFGISEVFRGELVYTVGDRGVSARETFRLSDITFSGSIDAETFQIRDASIIGVTHDESLNGPLAAQSPASNSLILRGFVHTDALLPVGCGGVSDTPCIEIEPERNVWGNVGAWDAEFDVTSGVVKAFAVFPSVLNRDPTTGSVATYTIINENLGAALYGQWRVRGQHISPNAAYEVGGRERRFRSVQPVDSVRERVGSAPIP